MSEPPPSTDQHVRWIGLAALAMLAMGLRQGDVPRAEAADAGDPAAIARLAEPGRHDSAIEAAGHRWSYSVFVPAGYDERTPVPLLLALHGAAGSGAGFVVDAGWDDLANREGLIVVAPDGLPMRPEAAPSRAFNPRLWNSGQHPSDRPRSQVDDLEFFDALLAEVAERWTIDPARTYAVGHSNGGAMALRLAAERSGTFAAVASVAGLCYVDDPRPAHGVPTLAIFGGADPILPTEGGLSVLPWEVRRTPPILPAMKAWAEATGSPMRPVTFAHDGTVHVFSYPPGRDGAVVSFLLLDGHGHVWPGGRPHPGEALLLGPRTDAIDATETIWAFFDGLDWPVRP